jgi:hypothetical protein
MRAVALVPSLALAVLAGCATSPAEEGKSAAEQRVYVTGSNVARRVDQPTGSPTYGISGDDMRKGRMRLPEIIPPPPCYRGSSNEC